jgi:flagellar M-ring protein FliF
VGANYSRGDKINVDVIPFDTQVNEQFDIAVKREEQRIRNLYIAGISAIAILIIIIIAYTVYRGFEARKIRAEEEKAIDDLLPQFEEFELETNMSVEDQERMDQENQIKQIAKQKPEEVANLIRNWLSED